MKPIIGIILAFAIGAIISAGFTRSLFDEEIQRGRNLPKQAIDLGYAEFNRTTGQWQWITNSVLER